ncbi:hypothetical protein CRUP_036779 [Coryphaenoides rupestris]|nr:hypothetical protein CRUP_036779 [Coryphaenoides rupestris]
MGAQSLSAAGTWEQVKEARVTEAQINEAREHYRPAAARASLLYFIMNDLNKIHPMYQFSLKAFSVVFQKAVQKAPPDDSLKQRVSNLIDSITSSVLLMGKEIIRQRSLDFLLRYTGHARSLCSMEEFRNLDRDIEGSAKRWQKFAECECPEKEKFPQEWKSKTSLQKLCMMRALRPDRMTYAVRDFVSEKLGSQYVAGRSLDFAASFEESGPATPMFFILSPGVDPLKDVEKHVTLPGASKGERPVPPRRTAPGAGVVTGNGRTSLSFRLSVRQALASLTKSREPVQSKLYFAGRRSPVWSLLPYAAGR